MSIYAGIIMSRVALKLAGLILGITLTFMGGIILSKSLIRPTNQIAFIAHRDDYHRIKLLDLERNLLVNVFSSPQRIDALTWTPNGKRLFMAIFREGRNMRDIAEFDLFTGEFRWITEAQFDNNAPDVSPDGRYLVYATYGIRGTGWNIESLDLTTMETFPIFNGAGNEGRPQWAPDGQRIAFERQVALSSSLVTIGANGRDLRVVSQELDYAPSWSPDGSRISFVSSRDNNFDLYLIAPNSANLRRLTMHGSADFYPAWSNDGTQLVFTSRRNGDQYDQLYLISLDDPAFDAPQRLTDADYNHISPVWRP